MYRATFCKKVSGGGWPSTENMLPSVGGLSRQTCTVRHADLPCWEWAGSVLGSFSRSFVVSTTGFVHAGDCTKFELWNADDNTPTGYVIPSGGELCQQIWGSTIEADLSDCIDASGGVYTEPKYTKLTMAAPTTDTEHFEGRIPLRTCGQLPMPIVLPRVTQLSARTARRPTKASST